MNPNILIGLIVFVIIIYFVYRNKNDISNLSDDLNDLRFDHTNLEDDVNSIREDIFGRKKERK